MMLRYHFRMCPVPLRRYWVPPVGLVVAIARVEQECRVVPHGDGVHVGLLRAGFWHVMVFVVLGRNTSRANFAFAGVVPFVPVEVTGRCSVQGERSLVRRVVMHDG